MSDLSNVADMFIAGCRRISFVLFAAGVIIAAVATG